MYSIHKYNTTAFGDGIAALRVSITIYRHSEMSPTIGNKFPVPIDVLLDHGLNHCPQSELDQMDNLLSIPLYRGALPDCAPSPLPLCTQPLVIVALQSKNNLPAVVLHRLYPGRKPSISNHQDYHNYILEVNFVFRF